MTSSSRKGSAVSLLPLSKAKKLCVKKWFYVKTNLFILFNVIIYFYTSWTFLFHITGWSIKKATKYMPITQLRYALFGQLRGSFWQQLRDIWFPTSRFLNMSLKKIFKDTFVSIKYWLVLGILDLIWMTLKSITAWKGVFFVKTSLKQPHETNFDPPNSVLQKHFAP